MNSNRTLLAATGALVVATGAAVLAGTATVGAAESLKASGAITAAGGDSSGHFTNTAFSPPAHQAGSSRPTPKPAVVPGVVVTYANNRSSVVVTGHRFGFDWPAAPTAPAKHHQR